jgi:hypothetical protein
MRIDSAVRLFEWLMIELMIKGMSKVKSRSEEMKLIEGKREREVSNLARKRVGAWTPRHPK